MTRQIATVVHRYVDREKWQGGKLIFRSEKNEIVYASSDLNEAAEYAEEHCHELASGDCFDIYYRHEED